MKGVVRFVLLANLILGSGVFAACPNPDGCNPDPMLNPPSTPSGVAATWWYTPEVNLSWNASTSPGGYSITYGVYRSTTSPVSLVVGNRIASVSSTSYRDLSVTTNVTYYYKVLASDANGDSPPSNEVNARPLPWPPLPSISGLVATSPSYTQINLTWNSVSYPSGEAYKVYRSTTSGFTPGSSTFLAQTNVASYSDRSASGTYYYKVTFLNDDNGAEGLASNQVSATTSAPAVINYNYGGSYGGPHALTSDGSRTFYYDANGNISQRSKPSSSDTCFSYVLSNKLQEVKNGSGCATKIATYFYDMDGNRIEKVVYGSNQTTRFFPSVDMEGSNLKYYYSGGGMRLAEEGPNGFYFYHGDHLASTSVLTRLDGTRAKEITYYPFGAVESETTFTGSDPGDTNHKYNDKFHDKETNYYDYGARFYDASLGRFTVPDTVVPSATSSQSLNRYAYVENNPLKYVDPSGHEGEAAPAASTPPLIPAHDPTGATADDIPTQPGDLCNTGTDNETMADEHVVAAREINQEKAGIESVRAHTNRETWAEESTAALGSVMKEGAIALATIGLGGAMKGLMAAEEIATSAEVEVKGNLIGRGSLTNVFHEEGASVVQKVPISQDTATGVSKSVAALRDLQDVSFVDLRGSPLMVRVHQMSHIGVTGEGLPVFEQTLAPGMRADRYFESLRSADEMINFREEFWTIARRAENFGVSDIKPLNVNIELTRAGRVYHIFDAMKMRME